MSRVYLSGAAILALSVTVRLHGEPGKAGEEPASIVKVTAADLAAGKVVVIGKLGVPLDTMTTVRGKWRPSPSDKDAGPWFHVTHVGGKSLGEPVDFHRALVKVEHDGEGDKRAKPSDGETWEFQGYETGKFRGIQDPTKQAPVWAGDHFLSELFGTMPRPGKPAKKTDPGKARRR